MIKQITNIDEIKYLTNTFHSKKKSVGFVPTMGALHAGHESLFKKSVSENDITVASIFVNRTQFNDADDYKNYPRNIESDLQVLEKTGVDVLFLPKHEELYNDDYRYRIVENSLSKILCGSSRPGHFEGVLTIVLKLLNIVSPTKAYFGEKDYQQYLLIDGMCKALFMNVEIVSCAIIREKDGLAMSSRNLLLTHDERKIAPNFYKILRNAESTSLAKTQLERLGFQVDYIEDLYRRRFGAVFLGKVRLIDNVQI
ncbi:MAG: pantothenate synthetase [Stygiobacter sp.]|nr:MAG: pantothenate synthetase [Stygiobacter sp.]KAF0217845.1 MAG: pantothenate [Ignavibacteria bacterium]